MQKPRLLLVDDHAVLRDSLACALGPDFLVAGSCADAESALAFLERESVDAVILDYSLPGLNGIEAARQMKARWPKLRVLLLSMHCGESEILQAFEAGASAYLPKSAPIAEVRTAISSVLRGRTVLSPQIARQVVQFCAQREVDERPTRPLTAQQVDVLRLAACGYANKQIADRLGLSVNTVKLRLKEIFGVLGARDRTHAVVVALKQGAFKLVDTEE